MSDSEGLRVKHLDIVSQWLSLGFVLITLDARRDGVVVPDYMRSDYNLTLRFGYDLKPPIFDLTLDADSIRGTLSFHQTSFHCTIPWTAVYQVTLGDNGAFFPSLAPPELSKKLEEIAAKAKADEEKAAVEAAAKVEKRAHLKLVP